MMSNVRLLQGTHQEGLNYYPTPKYITRGLLEKIDFEGVIFEPACGEGHIADVLKTKYQIFTNDIHDGYEYKAHFNEDFLLWDSDLKYSNIVTNPPYNLAMEFMQKSLEIATHKVALLMPIRNIAGSQERFAFYMKNPPLYFMPIPHKIDWFNKGNPIHECAWYVWDKKAKNRYTRIIYHHFSKGELL